jgi:AAA+ superfamily predicted ATPase
MVTPPVHEQMAWLGYADVALRCLLARHRATDEVSGSTGAAEGSSDELGEAELSAARERFFTSLRHEDSGFGAMAASARLSAADCEVLAFAVACELDAQRSQMLAYIQGDLGHARPSFQTIGLLLGGLERCPAVIGPLSRLRRAALLQVTSDGPWAQNTVEVPKDVVWAFLGDIAPDPDLPPVSRIIEVAEPQGEAPEDDELIVVVGPDRVRRRQMAAHSAHRSRMLVVPAAMPADGWAAVVREATLGAMGVIVELADRLGDEESLSDEGRRWIEQADHLAWALSSASEIPLAELPDRPWREIEIPVAELTEAEWIEAFGNDTPHNHRLSPQQVEQVQKVFHARGQDIDAAVRRLLAGQSSSFVQRIKPRRSWEDLVLAPERLEQLHSIVGRYRHASKVYDQWGFAPFPSRGLVSMFAGPSGSGKTLAAEVVAAELGLDVFKLNLSAVVSKYIGETEKNLDQIFDAAGIGNVVLFFDEADALFGKRSEVSDAHDRYANIEVAYLLQRVESFDGVVILTTNLANSIDDAFSRRIHVKVEFALPEASEREAIWRIHLPKRAPLGDVDLGWLATHLKLSGGQIRNAALQAAFVAAQADAEITMASLVQAAADEMRKTGRLLEPAEFGEWLGVSGD